MRISRRSNCLSYPIIAFSRYVDLGEDYFDKQKQQSIIRYAVRRLENLGYSVAISEVS